MACHKLPTIREIVPEGAEEQSIEDELTDSNIKLQYISATFGVEEAEGELHEEIHKYEDEPSCNVSECKSQSEDQLASINCIRYADKEAFANYVVESTLRLTAKKMYELECCKFEDYPCSLDSDIFGIKFCKPFYPVMKQNGLEDVLFYFKWPSVGEFTPRLGGKKILEFMASWYTREKWYYCLESIGYERSGLKNLFYYKSTWSLSTKPYPVPQVTASIFFTIVIEDSIPLCCPVKVTYKIEGSSLEHVPGRIIFRERWLLDLLQAKKKILKRIKF
ncbi:uncharacterized protein LOC108738440 [Agrilus planipennis]|uniref:Uncharacterized protein LOC108738440 n=1 Tax=Agrilus planipennis TaxID=224129 RepID=A0A1W4X3I0_AGRPL|nr:uncharacterized protein LOC108738440 [Agrilus planipennis]